MERIEIVKAERGEGKALTDFIKKVKAGMPEECGNWFSICSLDAECIRIDEGTDLAFKAVNSETGELAGVFTAVIPSLSGDENLGLCINLSEEELLKVAHMDTAAVSEKYRGRGLQKRLMEAAEKELSQEGYEYFMCTVHPDNSYSRNNILSLGYKPVWKGLKYGGKLREAMLKKIRDTHPGKDV